MEAGYTQGDISVQRMQGPDHYDRRRRPPPRLFDGFALLNLIRLPLCCSPYALFLCLLKDTFCRLGSAGSPWMHDHISAKKMLLVVASP